MASVLQFPEPWPAPAHYSQIPIDRVQLFSLADFSVLSQVSRQNASTQKIDASFKLAWRNPVMRRCTGGAGRNVYLDFSRGGAASQTEVQAGGGGGGAPITWDAQLDLPPPDGGGSSDQLQVGIRTSCALFHWLA